MIEKIIAQRKLPDIMHLNDGSDVTGDNWETRRKELIDILSECEYGFMPEKIGETEYEISAPFDFTDGKTNVRRITVKIPTPDGDVFSFGASLFTPSFNEHNLPIFVYMAFGYDFTFPIEEIVSKGIAVASFIYTDVVADNRDSMNTGLAAHYYKDGEREGDESGALGFWAFGASRLLDCLYDTEFIDRKRIGVIGHSRLGKAALWAGANDERFTHVFPNNSGCAGVSCDRGKIGENYPKISESFPYWFCPNMQAIASSPETAPFDQHFAVAAAAPRKLYAGCAVKDDWGDPYSEFISVASASEVWKMLGGKGITYPDYLPSPESYYTDGDIAYHLRNGGHSLCRSDWMRYIRFLTKD